MWTHTSVCLVCVTPCPCCSFQVCIYESLDSTENQIFFNIYLNMTLTAVSKSKYGCVCALVCTRCQKCHHYLTLTCTNMRERTDKVNQSRSHLFIPPTPPRTHYGLWTCMSVYFFFFYVHMAIYLSPNLELDPSTEPLLH